MHNRKIGFNDDESDKVRFYFNYLTGKVDHTGNTFFNLTEQWKYIGVYFPDTPLTATIIFEELKWVIHRWGKVVLHYSMTESEIAAYRAYIVKQITKTLTN